MPFGIGSGDKSKKTAGSSKGGSSESNTSSRSNTSSGAVPQGGGGDQRPNPPPLARQQTPAAVEATSKPQYGAYYAPPSRSGSPAPRYPSPPQVNATGGAPPTLEFELFQLSGSESGSGTVAKPPNYKVSIPGQRPPSRQSDTSSEWLSISSTESLGPHPKDRIQILQQEVLSTSSPASLAGWGSKAPKPTVPARSGSSDRVSSQPRPTKMDKAPVVEGEALQGAAIEHTGKGKAPIKSEQIVKGADSGLIETSPAVAKEDYGLSKAGLEQLKHMLQAYKMFAKPETPSSKVMQSLEKQCAKAMQDHEAKQNAYDRSTWYLKKKEDQMMILPNSVAPNKGIRIQMWKSGHRPQPSPKYDKSLQTTFKRWAVLKKALYIKENYVNLNHTAEEYRQECDKLAKQPGDKARFDQLLKHPEVVKLNNQRSGGLIIHGNDSTYTKAPTSSKSGFLAVLDRHLKDRRLRLLHATGLACGNKPTGEEGNRYKGLVGAQGLVRTLASQIYRHPYFTGKGQSTELAFFWDAEFCKAVQKGTGAAVHITFREMLLELAEFSLVAHRGPSRVIAIVDGIDWIEGDEGFQDAINLLRTICAEIECGDLGRYLEFQYVLINPKISTLAKVPHPMERHLFVQ